jgi:hypothetical protein
VQVRRTEGEPEKIKRVGAVTFLTVDQQYIQIVGDRETEPGAVIQRNVFIINLDTRLYPSGVLWNIEELFIQDGPGRQ